MVSLIARFLWGKMKKKNLRIVSFIVIVLVIFFIWRIFNLISGKKDNGFGNNSQRAVAVEIDKIKIASIKEIKEFTGTIYPEYQYLIAPKISGRLEKINFRIGDYVKKDEIVALIDDAEYKQTLLEAYANQQIAEANLEEANSQYNLAMLELNRVESLRAKEYISQSDLDAANANFVSAKSKVNLAEAQIEQRKAALKLAEIRLGYTVLKTINPGFIGERFSDEGSLLSPNTAVVSIVGIDKVIVRSNLIERIYGKVTVGQSAEIETDAYPDYKFNGYVSRIAPVLDEDTRMAEMEVEVDNPDHILKPGMFCRIKIVLSEKQNVPVVPNRAILTENGLNGIFLADTLNSIARYLPVKLGIVTEENTEILEPEIEGFVITLGHYQLKDGSKILFPEMEVKEEPLTPEKE